MPGERDARDGLHDDGRGGEKEVGDHHDARDGGHNHGLASEVPQQHEKGDAGAGPKQNRGADHVHILEDQISHQRSSRMASATMLSARMGQILSIGPSGSTHSPGTSTVPITTYTSGRASGAERAGRAVPPQ